MTGVPEKILILHDDYHAKYIGKLADGSQFFLSSAFDPAIGGKLRREFVALFIFDDDGALIEDRIDDVGTLGEAIQANVLPGNKIQSHKMIDERLKQRLAGLGDFRFDNIQIRPFEIERSGIQFGFIPLAPEEEDEDWCVEFHPGNFMAFYPPWDGEYDT